MAAKKDPSQSRAAWALAREQYGVLTRRDLMGLGFSSKAIRHRTETGRLRPLWRGVYAVGWTPLTPEGRWMGAVLACGDGAALSHRSAAALWGIGREREPIEVTIRSRGRVRLPGIKVHRRPTLPERSIVRRRGIPVTSPPQTLVDLAAELEIIRVERAVNEADKLDLIDPETLREALDGYIGVPGAKALRAMLDRHTFRLSDSDLEVLFRPLALAADLPLPLSKHWVLGYEVDFWFQDHRLVVETDGLRYHRTPAQQARAARRDQKHTAAGLRVVRFTHWQIAYEPDEVVDVLRRIRQLAPPAHATSWPASTYSGQK
jgi:very-short-patch-repair endonuclease